MAKRLTQEQKDRVKVLSSEDPSSGLFDKTLALVEDASEIHNVALKYVWDAEGEQKLETLLNHSLCDKGTVLQMYWRGDPGFYAKQDKIEDLHINNRNTYAFLKKLEALYLADNFNSNEIKFDPMERFNDELKKIYAGYTMIPDELLIKNHGNADENLRNLMTYRSGRSPLVTMKIPSPKQLRRGWAARAALYVANGWDDIYATETEWFYHDIGGNWACLRFVDESKALLIGFDHEYSKTTFSQDTVANSILLKDSPDWWSENVLPIPYGDLIGFIYAWEDKEWRRTSYTQQDGFSYLGLVAATKLKGRHSLTELATNLFGSVKDDDLAKLVKADGKITAEKMSKITTKNTDKAIEVAKNFLMAPVS